MVAAELVADISTTGWCHTLAVCRGAFGLVALVGKLVTVSVAALK